MWPLDTDGHTMAPTPPNVKCIELAEAEYYIWNARHDWLAVIQATTVVLVMLSVVLLLEHPIGLYL